MTIRSILATLYCIALTVGVWWIVRTNNLGEADFIANRDLPLNYQLQAGDVISSQPYRSDLHLSGTSVDNFVGRYVHTALPKGAGLRLSSTGTVPYYTAPPGHLMLLAALPRANAAGINAESCVRLNIKDQTPFLVQSVLCPAQTRPRCPAHATATPQPAVPCTDPPPADCAAVIDVPAARMQALVPPPAAPPPAALPSTAQPAVLPAVVSKARTKQPAARLPVKAPPVNPPPVTPPTTTPPAAVPAPITPPAATPLTVVASAPCP